MSKQLTRAEAVLEIAKLDGWTVTPTETEWVHVAPPEHITTVVPVHVHGQEKANAHILSHADFYLDARKGLGYLYALAHRLGYNVELRMRRDNTCHVQTIAVGDLTSSWCKSPAYALASGILEVALYNFEPVTIEGDEPLS